MLTAIGPGLASLQDYTNLIDARTIKVEARAGTALDQYTGILRDKTRSATIAAEDDLLFIDENDPNGWPVVNLFTNQSFEGTYVGGVAPSWAAQTQTGATFASSATAKYGVASQSVSIANVASGKNVTIAQQVHLPTDENGAALSKLPYFLSFWLQTPVAFTGATLALAIDWYNTSGGFITTTSVAMPANLGASWTRRFHTTSVPAGAASANCYVLITTTSSTNSGTILIDGAQFEYATHGAVMVMQGIAAITAIAAGKYPAPYCDVNQPGCYVDTGLSGLAYRQLRIFGGYVKHTKKDYTSSPERVFTVIGVEYGSLLQEAPADLVINQQTDVAAIAAAVTFAANKGYIVGLNASTYVQQLGIVQAMQFTLNNTLRDVLMAIGNQTNAVIWVDPYRNLHYASANAQAAPFGLSSSPDNVSTFPLRDFSLEDDSTNSSTAMLVDGGTQLSAPQGYSATGDGSTVTWVVNNQNPVYQVTAVTVGGVAQKVGVSGYDTLGSNGVQVIANLNAGTITFQTAPGNGVAITATYVFQAPALGLVHNFPATTPSGKIRRNIYAHASHPELGSLQAVIDRATGDLAQFSKPQKVGTVTVISPAAPAGVPLRVGMAIPITFAPEGLAGQYFLIQEVVTTVRGLGVVYRTLTLGAYRPDLAQRLAMLQRQSVQGQNSLSSGTVLNDVISAQDAWTITDGPAVPVVANAIKWDASTPYDSTFVWG